VSLSSGQTLKVIAVKWGKRADVPWKEMQRDSVVSHFQFHQPHSAILKLNSTRKEMRIRNWKPKLGKETVEKFNHKNMGDNLIPVPPSLLKLN